MALLELGGNRYPIPVGELVLGSDAACGIVVSGRGILPKHALFQGQSNGHVVIRKATPAAEVTINGVSRKVTQIAFPESVNNTVYRSGAYASRGSNPTSNLSDGIFADSLSAELVTPSGDAANGYAASCQVGVSL